MGHTFTGKLTPAMLAERVGPDGTRIDLPVDLPTKDSAVPASPPRAESGYDVRCALLGHWQTVTVDELDLPYSVAPRCKPCSGRALLREPDADLLAAASAGRLEVFTCPESDGWHVWAPVIEHPRLRAM
jgi:hypothetical protein